MSAQDFRNLASGDDRKSRAGSEYVKKIKERNVLEKVLALMQEHVNENPEGRTKGDGMYLYFGHFSTFRDPFLGTGYMGKYGTPATRCKMASAVIRDLGREIGYPLKVKCLEIADKFGYKYVLRHDLDASK